LHFFLLFVDTFRTILNKQGLRKSFYQIWVTVPTVPVKYLCFYWNFLLSGTFLINCRINIEQLSVSTKFERNQDGSSGSSHVFFQFLIFLFWKINRFHNASYFAVFLIVLQYFTALYNIRHQFVTMITLSFHCHFILDFLPCTPLCSV
jgi:hypothetical protein